MMEVEAVATIQFRAHLQGLGLLVEVAQQAVAGRFPGDTLVEEERPRLAALLQTHTELGTTNVVLVSMVPLTEVESVTKALVLAVASPTLLLAIHRVSVVPVLLVQVLALATVFMAPVGREMAVFFLKL